MLNRRRWLQSAAAALLTPYAAPRAQTAGPFTFETLIERAASLAARPFADPSYRIPAAWRALSYDQHRQIRYRRRRALWRNRKLFQLQFFHPGFLFHHDVAVSLLRDGVATPFGYQPERFHFGELDPQTLGTDGLGYAGLRVHYPLNRGSSSDEFAVFLGASYFRLIGRDQVYGLSARGLAVNTALPEGEEFPLFRAFWVEEPADDATSLTLYALLDSVSVTGAYRFVLHPRAATQADVHAVLFPRRDIAKLGIAPLTSMFLYGEERGRHFDDFRPEVHDSDGLMLHASSGEWLWRPLVNRSRLQVSAFLGRDPRGFGLIQRDRDFNNYQDLESQYHRRPSLWVQPLDGWSDGHVELVEIPSSEETNDNIVCYWVGAEPARAGRRLDYRYRLTAYADHRGPPGAYAGATRTGSATRPGARERQPESARLFVIDFDGGDLATLAADQPVEAIVTASSGRISEPVVQKNDVTGGWRVFFDFFPDAQRPADLRCFLRFRSFVLTETWNFLWTA